MNVGSFVCMCQKTKTHRSQTEKLTSPKAAGTAGFRGSVMLRSVSISFLAWCLSDGPVSSSLHPHGSQAAPAALGLHSLSFLSQ